MALILARDAGWRPSGARLRARFSPTETDASCAGWIDVSLRRCAVPLAWLSLFYLAAGVSLPERLLPAIDVVALLAFIGLNVTCAGHLVLGQRSMIWSPIPWFQLAAAVFFGLGPLIYYFGGEESILYCRMYYSPTNWELWRTNFASIAGTALVQLSILGWLHVRGVRQTRPDTTGTMQRFRKTWVFFLVLGMLCAFPVYLWSFGVLRLPPSAVQPLQVLGQFRYAALALLSYAVLSGRKRWAPVLVIALGADLFMAILTFSKEALIFPLLAVFLGAFTARPRKSTVIVATVAVALVYLASIGLVGFGRHETATNQAVQGRVDAVARYVRTDEDEAPGAGEPVKSWWARLTYNSPQAFAMRQYDIGLPGRTVDLALYTLVPRWIWPTKPVLTTGAQFNLLWASFDSAQSTPSIFAEAYWNYGWLGWFLVSFAMGGVFARFSVFSANALQRGQFLAVPIALVGVRLGMGFIDWFGATFAGAVVTAFWLYVALFLIAGPLFDLRVVRRPTSVRLHAKSSTSRGRAEPPRPQVLARR